MSITARIDATTHIAPEYRGFFLPAPRSVKIELTAACNYRCGYCVKSLRSDSQTMDRALYSRLIREMRYAGVDELGVFYIGESMTCKWLPDAIREAKAVGFPYVFLTTNGSLASPQRIMACMEAGLDSLKFSLNFADERQLVEVAKVPGSIFRRVLHNIKTARKIRDDGGYACQLYASSIQFDGEQGERIREIRDEIAPYLDEPPYWLPLYSMTGAAENAGLKPTAGNPGRVGALVPPLPCFAVTTGHVTSDGKLAACCFGTGLEGSLVMADLKSTSFMDGWNSAAFQTLRKAHAAQDVTGTGCEACIAG